MTQRGNLSNTMGRGQEHASKTMMYHIVLFVFPITIAWWGSPFSDHTSNVMYGYGTAWHTNRVVIKLNTSLVWGQIIWDQ